MAFPQSPNLNCDLFGNFQYQDVGPGLIGLERGAGRQFDPPAGALVQVRIVAQDQVFSRAFGPVYVVIEMALPLLKKGGYLYIYSKLQGADLGRGIADHAVLLGGRVDPVRADGPGIIVRKIGDTPDAYPRRYPAIKRAAERAGGDAGHET